MKERTNSLISKFFEENGELSKLKNDFINCSKILLEAVGSDKVIYVCGNGGSAADSEHIAGELLKSFCLKRKISKEVENKISQSFPAYTEKFKSNLQGGIRCIPLTSFIGFNSAFSNDCDSAYVYAQLVNVLAREGDVLISISTSGNSENVFLASVLAKSKGMKVLTLTGKDGGKLREISDVSLIAPSSITHNIQEYHIKLYHLLCLVLESEKFDE